MICRPSHLVISAAALLLSLSACGGDGGNPEAEADKEEDKVSVPVEVASARRGDVNAYYSGTATLEAEEDAEVVAKVGGVVEELLVEEGDYVEKDQVLARIDDARLSLEVARAEANLAKLQQEYQRNRQLAERQLVSAEAFERLTYDVDAVRADLDLARLQLAYTEIRAPFSGVVSARYIKVGNMIGQNEPAFRVTNFDPLLARLHVPERELNKLRKDQLADVRVDALPAQTFIGAVDRVSPVVDSSTGTFTVTVAVRDPSNVLKPGMFGRVAIVHDRRQDTLLVPRTAVITQDAKDTVFVVNDGTAQRRAVTTGYTNNGSIEIVAGLEDGDRVVTVGHNSLKDGARVSVINGDSAKEEVVAENNETQVAAKTQ
jgi:membrane fusion protein (multidrug efflux system)